MHTGDNAADVSVRRLRRLLVLILGLWLWGFGTHGTHAGTGDEPHYLVIAHSLAFDHDLDLSNNYGALEPLIAGGHLVPEGHVREMPDGALRPVHDIGLPLIFAPVVRVLAPLTARLARTIPEPLMRSAKLEPTTLYRHAIGLAMIVPALLLAVLLFNHLLALGARLTHPARGAFAATLLLMASPPLLAYSTLFFTELISALLAFFAFTRLLSRRDSGPAWLALGGLIGFLLLLHIRNVGLVIGFALIATRVLLRDGRRRHAAAFLVGLAAALALRTAIIHHLWGTWVMTPHARSGSFEGWQPALQLSAMRLIALLFDQEYGLFVYAPIYILAFAGLPLILRFWPTVGSSILVLTVSYLILVLLPYTNIHGWSGQWCPAGRFLMPIIPFLAIPVFVALRAWPRATAILVVLQIGLSAYWWQHPKLLWNDGDGRAAFCDRTGDDICRRLPAYAQTVK